LNSRIVIEQAKGALAQANGIPVDAAFEMIRTYARRNNRRLGDVAGQILSDLTACPTLPNRDAHDLGTSQ
jgi:AmiR/NasT family two-component response regulator